MAEATSRFEEVPVVYIALLFLILLSTAIATTLITARIAGGIYPSAYFTAETLFNAVGVDSSGSVLANAPIFSPNFYTLLPLLVLDGLVKIAVIGFIIAGVVEMVAKINIRARLISMRAKGMRGATIICDYNALTDELCSALTRRNMPFIIVEKDRGVSEMLIDRGYNVVNGDFTQDATLRETPIEKARAVVFASESDFDSMLGIVTAHHINSSVKIISRAKEESTVSKMHRAGASLCVVPEVLAGLELGEKIAERVG